MFFPSPFSSKQIYNSFCWPSLEEPSLGSTHTPKNSAPYPCPTGIGHDRNTWIVQDSCPNSGPTWPIEPLGLVPYDATEELPGLPLGNLKPLLHPVPRILQLPHLLLHPPLPPLLYQHLEKIPRRIFYPIHLLHQPPLAAAAATATAATLWPFRSFLFHSSSTFSCSKAIAAIGDHR